MPLIGEFMVAIQGTDIGSTRKRLLREAPRQPRFDQSQPSLAAERIRPFAPPEQENPFRRI
jgi:hypothetical protein